jgi:hypothetical protein
MHAEVNLPKAFSVHDENEFFPIQHLMARMNSELMVVEVATGTHKSGGCTVYWGLTYLNGQHLTKQDVTDALEEAGFDLTRGSIHDIEFLGEERVVG